MQKLIELFKQNHGYLKSKQLEQNGHLYRQLKKLVEEGKVEKLKPGLYCHPKFVKTDAYARVCKIYPQAVLCLYSAWAYYDLSTFVPAQYHLAIPNKTKLVRVDYPPVQFYYWSHKYFDIAIEENEEVRIYSLEKSVCDAVRFQNKVGLDLTAEVLKTYLDRNDRDIDKLLKVAHQLGQQTQVRKHIEFLL